MSSENLNQEQTPIFEKVSGKRQVLGEILPLNAPLSINVTVANVCNLKCEFCANSVDGHQKNKNFMELDIAKRLSDTCLKSFGRGGVKQAVLSGGGEPLLNKEIDEIVSSMAQSGAFGEIHIVTNGTRLTKELSRKLAAGGLDVLRVSINGLSDEDYIKYTGVKVDYLGLLEQLRYFYENKKNVRVYAKIMDYMVADDAKMERFWQDFKSCSDVQNIEYVTNLSNESKNSRLMTQKDRKINIRGGEEVKTEICPFPFYSLNVNAEGTVSACCRSGTWFHPSRLIVGDLRRDTMSQIWNGQALKKLYIEFLKGRKEMYDLSCRNCEAYIPFTYKEDLLDAYAQELLRRYEKDFV